MDKVTIVSADGHTVMEPELAEYLEQEFHEHLPAFDANARSSPRR